jgi:hypothetical protein
MVRTARREWPDARPAGHRRRPASRTAANPAAQANASRIAANAHWNNQYLPAG